MITLENLFKSACDAFTTVPFEMATYPFELSDIAEQSLDHQTSEKEKRDDCIS